MRVTIHSDSYRQHTHCVQGVCVCSIHLLNQQLHTEHSCWVRHQHTQNTHRTHTEHTLWAVLPSGTARTLRNRSTAGLVLVSHQYFCALLWSYRSVCDFSSSEKQLQLKADKNVHETSQRERNETVFYRNVAARKVNAPHIKNRQQINKHANISMLTYQH